MSKDTTPDMPSLASQELAFAEADALKAEGHEQDAHREFDALRDRLAAVGKAHEASQHPEFHRWMNSREITDAAWGRWAMAMDVVQDLQARESPPQKEEK